MQDTLRTCEACRESFTTGRARDRFCPECRTFIQNQTAELESMLDACDESPNRAVRDELWGEFLLSLECHLCGWSGNKNRLVPGDPRISRPYVEGWIIALLKHRCRHAFPGRFPHSRQFTPKWIIDLDEWQKWVHENFLDFLIGNGQALTEYNFSEMVRTLVGGTREDTRRPEGDAFERNLKEVWDDLPKTPKEELDYWLCISRNGDKVARRYKQMNGQAIGQKQSHRVYGW